MYKNAKEFINKHRKLILSELFVYVLCLIAFFAPVVLASAISAENVVKMVNGARVAAKIHVLEENEMLKKAAEEKANDMVKNDYFAHTSPEGISPWQWIAQNNYDYRYAGENLAINFTNAEDQQKAWMDSETHRKNILNPNYEEIGVAVRQGIIDGQDTIVVVQMFGKQAGAANAGENIAGAEIVPNDEKIAAPQKDFATLLRENKTSMYGWLFAFCLAIFFILVDVAALVHKRHEPLFMTHNI